MRAKVEELHRRVDDKQKNLNEFARRLTVDKGDLSRADRHDRRSVADVQ